MASRLNDIRGFQAGCAQDSANPLGNNIQGCDKCLTEGWKRTVNDGLTNSAWDVYDHTIQQEVKAYNVRFATTTGYAHVDWKMIKAMLWVETGALNPAWKSRPMQIGNKGDSAYTTLKNGIEKIPKNSEGSEIIMSDDLKAALQNEDISTPILNVRAGTAYVFTRMAKTEHQSVIESTDPTPLKYTVQKSENLDMIARKVGSTPDVMKKLNGEKTLHVGDTVLYHKAKIQRVIIGWRKFTLENIADRYNVTGDACYKQKLDYVLALINKKN